MFYQSREVGDSKSNSSEKPRMVTTLFAWIGPGAMLVYHAPDVTTSSFASTTTTIAFSIAS
jgi:hypothetical protein